MRTVHAMIQRMSVTEAVYFRREDYAPFWLRLFVGIIDGFVAAVVVLPMFAVLRGSLEKNLLFLLCLAVVYAYFVLLKRTKVGTLGYLMTGVRIVGPDGQAASLASLTVRLAFMMLGPLNLLDIIWLSGDAHRQALRDKFAQTYVVKRKAAPAGTGKLIYRYYDILGYNFLFREIEPVLRG